MVEQRRPVDMAFVEEEEESSDGGAMAVAMHSEFDEKEQEVCEILLNFGSLVEKSELASLEKLKESELRDGGGRERRPFTVVWGAKKILVGSTRRKSISSAALAKAKTTTTTTRTVAATASPSQQVKVLPATSPDTPLNFSRSSESEENSSIHRQLPRPKKKRKELMQTVEGLSERRELLTKEVEKVTIYLNELSAYNKLLKEKKQMAVPATCTSHDEEDEDEAEEKSNLEMKNSFTINSSQGVRSGQIYQTAVNPQPHESQWQFMVNPPNPMAMAMTMVVESHPQPQGKLQYQSPSPVKFGQVGPAMAMFATPSAVMGGGGVHHHVGRFSSNNGTTKEVLTQSQSSLDYAAASARAFAESKARFKAAEARKHRKMMINRQRLQLNLKLK